MKSCVRVRGGGLISLQTKKFTKKYKNIENKRISSFFTRELYASQNDVDPSEILRNLIRFQVYDGWTSWRQGRLLIATRNSLLKNIILYAIILYAIIYIYIRSYYTNGYTLDYTDVGSDVDLSI